MDYNELVKSLRQCSEGSCAGCKNDLVEIGCRGMLQNEAADVIEELQATIEREKTYTQFWEDAAENCKAQYEKMEKRMLDWQAVAYEHRDAYHHWFENYQNDVPKWIPVTERLPKYGERVLVFGGVTMYVAYYDKNRYGIESWHKLNSKNHYCNPSHWMPLPEPPKEETE